MKSIISLFVALFALTSCDVIHNIPQKSNFMKVGGGGYQVRMGIRGQEELYGINVELEEVPQSAKYIIADFELPNNRGIYDRKVYQLNGDEAWIALVSDPIYGVKFGYYYIKVYLSEDEGGYKIIDALKQSVKISQGISKGRDYATEYTVYNDKGDTQKLLVIFPNDRKNNSYITSILPNEFDIGHAVVTSKRSIVEYIPKGETIDNWSKIMTIMENENVGAEYNKAYVRSFALGQGMHDEFFGKDKDFQLAYSAIYNGKFISTDTPNFQELVKDSQNVIVYVDYRDNIPRSEKFPNEREFLVANSMKSDVSVWMLQCTVRYDKRWKKSKIDALKKEAVNIVSSLQYTKSNPIDDIYKMAESNHVKNLRIEAQRLDDRDFNEKYQDVGDSPYEKE